MLCECFDPTALPNFHPTTLSLIKANAKYLLCIFSQGHCHCFGLRQTRANANLQTPQHAYAINIHFQLRQYSHWANMPVLRATPVLHNNINIHFTGMVASRLRRFAALHSHCILQLWFAPSTFDLRPSTFGLQLRHFAYWFAASHCILPVVAW